MHRDGREGKLRRTDVTLQHLAKKRQPATPGNHTPTLADEFAPQCADMVAPDERRIIQAICLIEEKMKSFQRDVWSRCLAEKPIHFDKIRIPGTGRI